MQHLSNRYGMPVMEYLELRKILGADLTGPLEDAVLSALSSTKDSQAEGRALRGVVVALLGAVIWARPDLGDIDWVEKQCARDLTSALKSLSSSGQRESNRHLI